MAVPLHNTVSSSIDGKNINFSHCSAGLQVLREREGFKNLCLSITELRVFRRHWISQTARRSDQTH